LNAKIEDVRADRLVAILLMLQAKGQVTAAEVAEERRAPVVAQARARPEAIWVCRTVFGNRVRIGPTTPDGRVEVELRGQTARSLAGEVAGLGAMVEILGPPEVRRHLADVAAELAELYAGGPG
jgi:predicted DNA-binding transcriptional regulator YafY